MNEWNAYLDTLFQLLPSNVAGFFLQIFAHSVCLDCSSLTASIRSSLTSSNLSVKRLLPRSRSKSSRSSKKSRVFMIGVSLRVAALPCKRSCRYSEFKTTLPTVLSIWKNLCWGSFPHRMLISRVGDFFPAR
ncbi:hypothetical protein D3C86_1753120 [compost metagenome]